MSFMIKNQLYVCYAKHVLEAKRFYNLEIRLTYSGSKYEYLYVIKFINGIGEKIECASGQDAFSFHKTHFSVAGTSLDDRVIF